MDSSYNPKSIEAYWSAHWEEQGYAKPSGVGEPYCIMLPPPNVTGSLHMGHGFQVSLMDSLIRYHRMSGYNTHWQVGTDHAGIATQWSLNASYRQRVKTANNWVARPLSMRSGAGKKNLGVG